MVRIASCLPFPVCVTVPVYEQMLQALLFSNFLSEGTERPPCLFMAVFSFTERLWHDCSDRYGSENSAIRSACDDLIRREGRMLFSSLLKA